MEKKRLSATASRENRMILLCAYICKNVADIYVGGRFPTAALNSKIFGYDLTKPGQCTCLLGPSYPQNGISQESVVSTGA